MIEPVDRHPIDFNPNTFAAKLDEVIEKVNGIDQAQDQQINNETELLKTLKTTLDAIGDLQERVKDLERYGLSMDQNGVVRRYPEIHPKLIDRDNPGKDS